jgi:hypothetical protein
MNRRSIIVTSLMPFVLWLAAVAMAADPFVGTWKMNMEKSMFPQGQAPKSAILAITRQENVIRLTTDLVATDGKSTHEEASLNLDGKEQPVKGNPNINTIIFRRLDANTLESVGKKEGIEVGSTSYIVTKDGKTLTTTMKRKNPQGQDVSIMLVYDKQ